MPKLPKDLLITRIRNEFELCTRKSGHVIAVEDPTYKKFPIKIMVTLLNTGGPIFKDGKVTSKLNHQFIAFITEEYPYQKPIVQWQTPIFHPNIQLPEEGGNVCTKLLENWGFHSNLLSFIKGIESLLSNPNPKSPWGTDSCTRAAEYFNKQKFLEGSNESKTSSARGPKIVR